ncbi:MAG: branched-chain amino acid ABC transporter permease [Desulfobacteraceae bacterium]|nr:branched-chain amino acid ABC transporter permease [Desulfobacteraceae bacterium]
MAKQDYIRLCVLSAVIAVLPMMMKNDYYIGVCVFAAFNCLACIGLSLLMGYAGQISLCQAAFIAIGAYSSAIFTVKLGWSPWIAMLAGAGLTGITAVSVGVPSLRLKGHYLAMATLGFGSILNIVLIATVKLTGGPEGINGIPDLNLFGTLLTSDRQFFLFFMGSRDAGAVLRVESDSFPYRQRTDGNSWQRGCCVRVRRQHRIVQNPDFIISAVYSSIAGSLYAYYVNYIDPGPFDITHSILLLTMVAVGGMHTIWGAVIGSILLTLLPEFLSFVSGYLRGFGIAYKPDYDILLYGGILLSIMLFLPEGLSDGIVKLLRRVIPGTASSENV